MIRARTDKIGPIRPSRVLVCYHPLPIRGWMRFLLLSLFIVFMSSPQARGAYLLEGEGIRVVFERPYEPIARELVQAYPRLKDDLEKIFGWDVGPTSTVLLIRNSMQFQKWVDSPLTVAFARPGENLVVIDYSRMNAHPFGLNATFKHELCHLY